MNRSKLIDTYKNNSKFYKSTRNSFSAKLNDDVIDIIKAKIYKDNTIIAYHEIKNTIASLIVLFYNKLDSFCDSDKEEENIHYLASKFNPERDFKILYHVLCELFEKYHDSSISLHKVSIGKSRPYFIYESTINKYNSNYKYWILVYYEYSRNSRGSKPNYEFYMKKYNSLEEAKNAVKNQFKFTNPQTGSTRSISVEKSPY